MWNRFAPLILGLWLISAPKTFGYDSHALTLSDQISGLLALIFGLLALKKTLWNWGIALIGIWLQAAPLLFWSKNAACYLNDTLMGSLLIFFSLILEGFPGIKEDSGAEIPHGWSYNPSAYIQRLPIIALNFFCWLIARYLAAYQLGYITTVWDPLFGAGTHNVLTSSVSKLFPVSDAGLGAFAYTLEVILGFGGTRRWHCTPWLVIGFGLLVIPVSCISILLIISQPLIVGSWCFLCLVTAGLMVWALPLAVDEVIATLQFLHQQKKQGKSLLKLLFLGSPSAKGSLDARSPSLLTPWRDQVKAMRWGLSLPWNLSLALMIGVLAMFHHVYIPAALTIVLSAISFAELTRTARFLLIPVGVWMFFSAPILGAALIALSFRKGAILERYGVYKIR